MTTNPDHFPSLSALLREGLGDAIRPEAAGLLDMMTDDISFEFPFAVPGGPTVIEGKATLAEYLPKVGKLFTIEALRLDRAILSADGRHAVLEFTGKAHANKDGARYDQTYISVIDIRGGLISRYRDYWNPLIVLSATEGAGEVLKNA